jgi:hypothetical protein
MTVGVASATANSWLNALRGTSYSVATLFVKLHIGDPGAAGTANAAALTTRNALTMNAASAGSMTLSSLAAFVGVSTETISHLSVWDNVSAGNLIATGALSASKTINLSDTLTLTSLTMAITPLAA